MQTVINVSGSAVTSSAVLGALIIRHCLDDEIAVRQIFEKTVRTIAAGGYTINPPLTRWNHIRHVYCYCICFQNQHTVFFISYGTCHLFRSKIAMLFKPFEDFRTPRTTRDWLHAIRALSPLCARHPQIFAATMERVTRKQKDQITVLPMTPVDPSCKQWAACSPIKQVSPLLNTVILNIFVLF